VGSKKKRLENDIDEDDTDKDDMAVTHHDDLKLIKDVVRLSQNARGIYTSIIS
jgi:hypothetical protein